MPTWMLMADILCLPGLLAKFRSKYGMSDHRVNTTEARAPSHLPLLFFVTNRRKQILLAGILSAFLLMPTALFSSGMLKAINNQRWGAVVLFASCVLFLGFPLV